jgi:hypothetical protein
MDLQTLSSYGSKYGLASMHAFVFHWFLLISTPPLVVHISFIVINVCVRVRAF